MALAANTNLDLKNRLGETRIDGLIATSGVIYNHALVARIANGKLAACADEVSHVFVGLAELVNVPNTTAGLTGDGNTVRVDCISDVDVLIPCITAITVGNVGGVVYALDDQTATTAVSAGPQIGIITEFVATNSIWVRLRGSLMAVGQ